MIRGCTGTLLVAVVLTACGGTAVAPGGQPASRAPGAGGGTTGDQTFDTGGLFSFIAPALPTLRPSGARFRVVNAYAPLNGDPGAVDVYSGVSPGPGDKPLVTVPYGAVSDWFDPGVFDEQGDASLAYYPAGKTGQDYVMSKSETLKGDEQVTVFLVTGPNSRGETRLGELQETFERGQGVVPATPAPGRSLLTVVATGLDNTLSSKEHLWLVGGGSGCLFAVQDPDFPQPVGPGSATTYAIDPATRTVSLHEFQSGVLDAPPACDKKPFLGDIPVSLVAGGSSYLFLFSAGKDQLKTLSIPAGT